MRRLTVFMGCVWLCAGLGADPAPAAAAGPSGPSAGDRLTPVPMAKGWAFTVRRKAVVARTLGAPGTMQVRRGAATEVQFTEHVDEVAGGEPTRVTRTLIAATAADVHPVTGQFLPQPVGRKGSRYGVHFDPTTRDITLTDLATDRTPREPWAIMLIGRLVNRLWPDDRLQVGRTWSYKGNEFDRRAENPLLQDGTIDLEVKAIEKDAATGLDVAKIRGRLKSKILQEEVALDYQADVTIDLPPRLGVPLVAKIDGTFSGNVMMVVYGHPVGYPITGTALFEQTAAPTRETLAALEKTSTSGTDTEALWGVRKPDQTPDVIRPTTPTGRYEAREERLVHLRTEKIERLAVTSDGRRWALQVRLPDGKWAVVTAEGVGQAYDDVYSLQFSRDGKRLLYKAKRDGKETLVCDGREEPLQQKINWWTFRPRDGRLFYVVRKGDGEAILSEGAREEASHEHVYSTLLFGPDAERPIYSITKGGRFYIVTGGTNVGPYDELVGLTLSADGRHWVCRARDEDRWCVVRDGRAGASYDDVDALVLAPQGDGWAYRARGNDKTCRVVVNGEEEPPCHAAENLTFSPDGKRFAYLAERRPTPGTAQFAVIEKGVAVEWRGVKVRGFHFTADSSRLVYLLDVRDNARVFVNHQPGPTYRHVESLLVGPEAPRFTYVASPREDEEYLIDGDSKEGPYRNIWIPRFTSDGRHVAYLASKDGTWRVVAGNRDQPGCEAHTNPGQWAVSPDLNRSAFVGTVFEDPETVLSKGFTFVAVDGQPGPRYRGFDLRSLLFSPDGKHLAYLVERKTGSGQKEVFATVEHEAGPAFPELHDVRFARDGDRPDAPWVLTYLAPKADGLYRIRHVPVGAAGTVAAAATAKPGIEEERLLQVPGATFAYLVERGRDGYVAEARKGDKRIPIFDGKVGRTYDRLGAWTDPKEGRPHACTADVDGKRYVIIDGKEQGPYDLRASDLEPFWHSKTFSPDGTRLAYAARHGAAWSVFVNEVPGPEFPEIVGFTIGFSPDGTHVAYAVKKDGFQHAVVNGTPGPALSSVRWLTFNPAGQLAYIGQKTQAEGWKCALFVDGREQAVHDDATNLEFTPDGRMVYRAEDGGKWAVIVDGKPEPACDSIAWVESNADGSRLAYCGKKGNKYFVADVGRPGTGPLCDSQVYKAHLSPHGGKLAYAAVIAKKAHVVLERDPGPAYESVAWIGFTPDGARLIYAAKRDGKWFLVEDRKEKRAYDDVGPRAVSDDGAHVAYAAKQGEQWLIIADDAERYRPSCAKVHSLAWGPGAAPLVCVARTQMSGEEARVIVDGQAGATYSIVSTPRFVRAGERDMVTYLAAKGDTLYRVRHFAAATATSGGVPRPVSSGSAVPGSQENPAGQDRPGHTAAPAAQEQAVFRLPGVTFTSVWNRKPTGYAVKAKRGDKGLLIVDGRASAEYDDISGADIAPGTDRTAYTADLGDKRYVLVDGTKVEGPYDRRPADKEAFWHRKRFSRDGTKLAYKARQGSKCCVVVNGEPGPLFDGIDGDTIEFSPDGRHLAYVAYRGSFRKAVVLDGTPGPAFEDVMPPVFAPDGRLVYAGLKSEDDEDQDARKTWRLMVAGRQEAVHDRIRYIKFGADARLVYAALDQGKWAVVVNGQRQAACDDIDTIKFSDDGRRLIYCAKKGDKQCVAEVGKPAASPLYDAAYDFRFSPGGTRLAYIAKEGEKCRVVLDGAPHPLYDSVDSLDFTPDGRGIVYKARDQGKAFIVRDKTPGPQYDKIGARCFTEDGSHFAYTARQGNQWLTVVDGKPGRPIECFRSDWVTLSPDGACVASHGAMQVFSGEDFIVVDGQPGPRFTSVAWPEFSRPAGGGWVVTYFGVRGDTLYRVRHAGSGVPAQVTREPVPPALAALEPPRGASALIKACAEGADYELEELLFTGEEINAKDSLGRTAIMYAAANGYADIVSDLLDWLLEEPELNVTDKDGKTALILAAERGHTAAVRALLKAKADASIKDKSGKAALMHARERGHEAVVALLTGAPDTPPADPVERAKFYRNLAEGGDAKGMFELARMYDGGTGVGQDRTKAAEWYRKAAGKGHIDAMFRLGEMYDYGRGVEKDAAESSKWYLRAAQAGHVDAMVNIGWAYSNGAGVARDAKEAVKWYRKAAEAGEALAMHNLAIMYAAGRGVDKDDAEAAKWYLASAENGHVEAMVNIGWRYHTGTGVAKDEAKALAWYRKAADAGNATGMFNLGLMYRSGSGVEQDDARAADWYRKAAEKGEPSAMLNLGNLYDQGLGVPKDPVKAVEWYRKAAEAGNSAGMFNLAWMYEHGSGVAQSKAEALNWYRKAAEAGDDDGKEAVKRLEQE